ncbi:MAG: hypothetical protein AAFX08_04230 [Pseudomonadota bacterium]
MTQTGNARIAGALKELLFAQEKAVAAAIRQRRRQHLRLLLAGAALLILGSGGLGAFVGGEPAARPLLYIAVLALPLCLLYYGFLLGRAVSLRQEISRIRSTLGALAVAAQDAKLSEADAAELGQRFAAVDSMMLKARKLGLN